MVEALKSGTASLKRLHAEINVESVEDVMDELNEVSKLRPKIYL